MPSVENGSTATSFQAFTVLIPRPLRPTVEGLPPEVRQALLAELFRMASLAQEQRGMASGPALYTLRVEVAGCTAHVELDAARSRLTLVGLPRRVGAQPEA